MFLKYFLHNTETFQRQAANASVSKADGFLYFHFPEVILVFHVTHTNPLQYKTANDWSKNNLSVRKTQLRSLYFLNKFHKNCASLFANQHGDLIPPFVLFRFRHKYYSFCNYTRPRYVDNVEHCLWLE